MNFGNIIEWKIPYNSSISSVEEVRETETGRIIWQGMISVIYHDSVDDIVITYDDGLPNDDRLSANSTLSIENTKYIF